MLITLSAEFQFAVGDIITLDTDMCKGSAAQLYRIEGHSLNTYYGTSGIAQTFAEYLITCVDSLGTHRKIRVSESAARPVNIGKPADNDEFSELLLT